VTAAVAPGAVLVDWYPQLAARAHGRWDREEVGSVGDVGHADPGAAVVALTVPKGWRVAGARVGVGSARGERREGDGHLASSLHGEAGARELLGGCVGATTSQCTPNSVSCQ
jgi:hypothetical protein